MVNALEYDSFSCFKLTKFLDFISTLLTDGTTFAVRLSRFAIERCETVLVRKEAIDRREHVAGSVDVERILFTW